MRVGAYSSVGLEHRPPEPGAQVRVLLGAQDKGDPRIALILFGAHAYLETLHGCGQPHTPVYA